MTENEKIQREILVVLRREGPLKFRKIEAHLVLSDIDVSTYDIQVAMGRLGEKKAVELMADFRNTLGPTWLQTLSELS